ncbi:UNVERIFIED_ORG: hypothetical protein ABIC48_000375 [Burkholderia territorii]
MLGHQREQEQLKIVGAELAAARHRVVAEIAKAAAPAPAAERAATECIVAAATVAADRVPETGEPVRAGMRTMTVASGMAAEVVVSHDRILCVVKHI